MAAKVRLNPESEERKNGVLDKVKVKKKENEQEGAEKVKQPQKRRDAGHAVTTNDGSPINCRESNRFGKKKKEQGD